MGKISSLRGSDRTKQHAAVDRGGSHFFFNYKRQIFIIYKYLPCMGLNIIYEPVA